MSDLYINLNGIRKANDRLPYVAARVESVKQRLEALKREMPDGVAGMYGIGQRLTYVSGETEKIQNNIKRLHDVINSCVQLYEDMEIEIERNSAKV